MRKPPFAACHLALSALAFVHIASTSSAQIDDPFGTTPTTSPLGSDIAPIESPIAPGETLPPDDHPVVQSLRAAPPQTPVEISRAILYLLRIERYDEAKRFLDRLKGTDFPESTARKMVDAAGLETWIKIENDSDRFSQEQRSLARKIINASSISVQGDVALSAAIAKLRDSNIRERQRAFLALKSAGDAGIAAILSAAGRNEVPLIAAAEMATQTGEAGASALRAALTASDKTKFETFCEVASLVRGNEFVAELSQAAHILDPSSPVRKKVLDALSPAGQAIPKAESAARYLAEKLKAEINDYIELRESENDLVERSWRWRSEAAKLERVDDSKAGLALCDAYEKAVLLLKHPQSISGEPGLPLAIVFEDFGRRSQLARFVTTPVQSKLWADLNTLPLRAEDLLAAWNAAFKNRLYFAQFGILQACRYATPKVEGLEPSKAAFVADALRSGVPAIRYAACLWLLDDKTLDPTGPIAVLSKRTIEELRQLEGKSLALVVGGAVERRDMLTQQLSQLGIRSVSLSNSRETMRVIQEPAPFEFVFVVDRVLEVPVSELVQRIRAYPTTSRIPIVLMTPSDSTLAWRGTEDLVGIHFDVLTSDIAKLAATVERVSSLSVYPQLDALDRAYLRTRTPVETSSEKSQAKTTNLETQPNDSVGELIGTGIRKDR